LSVANGIIPLSQSKGVTMTLSLLNGVFIGKFFNGDSAYVNHKIVNVIAIDDDRRMAHVVLQRYTIGAGANVYTNGNSLLNVELPYSEFEKVFK
jgi:hypothetical protein